MLKANTASLGRTANKGGDMGIKSLYTKTRKKSSNLSMTVDEFFEEAKVNPAYYATPAERMLTAIGEPTIIETEKDSKLSRIFSNRRISVYKSFSDFYGLEETIEKIVSFYRHAAQGFEEAKQIQYLVGPVGSSKSSLAERQKELMETQPIYVLGLADGTLSPIFESPLNLFGKGAGAELGIPDMYLQGRLSPWATKRLAEFNHDLTKFRVYEVYPNQDTLTAIAKAEPGDENNQDISALVGKIDLRKLEEFSANDTDCYSYSGALCRANQGLMEFVEMFKAPLKTLHPLLTATQEGNYNPTETGIPSIPFNGIILAHSNETEWDKFKSNKQNEAFLDRIYTIDVPYCLRYDEEEKIYLHKKINATVLRDAPLAPDTLTYAAKFAVLSRLDEPDNSSVFSKLEAYTGAPIKDVDPKAKTCREYKEGASYGEGFHGISTRFMFKALARAYNYDSDEVANDPVKQLKVIEQMLNEEKLPKDVLTNYLAFLDQLNMDLYDELSKQFQKAYLESFSERAQRMFENYLYLADRYHANESCTDPDTGELLNLEAINETLTRMEKKASIGNPKDFRQEIVNFALRYHKKFGTDPRWDASDKFRELIEANILEGERNIMPVLVFDKHKRAGEKETTNNVVKAMEKKGYTKKQIKFLYNWVLARRTR